MTFLCFDTAKRTCSVEVANPWGNMNVQRNLPALKFYHDFTCGKILFSIELCDIGMVSCNRTFCFNCEMEVRDNKIF